jgi:hypothetical protein
MKRSLATQGDIKLTGKWRLTARYRGTDKVARILEGNNLIVTVGKEQIGDMLIDAAGYDTGLTYCAIGSDNTPPTIVDTVLGTEENRRPITVKSRVTNVITLSTYFSYADCTYAIEEAGIFGHDATGVADSGVLFSHWLVSFDNTGGLYDLTFDYELTIG